MRIVADFLSRIIFENSPSPIRFLDPQGTLAELGVDHVLQAVFPGHFIGPSRKGGKFEILVKVFGGFANAKGNRRNPGTELVLAPPHRAKSERQRKPIGP